MAETLDEHGESTAPARRWQFLSVSAILAIGWIIYEVSHSPGLAAMVMCLKFGWEDFRTARWLRRRDPWEVRGRATSMMYLASGMWKAAMMGIVMVFVTLLALPFGNGNNGNGPVGPLAKEETQTLLLGAFGATLIGQAIASLACGRALQIARRYKIPLWLSGAVHFARHQNDWPPYYGFANRLVWLNASCFLFNWLVFVPIVSIALGDFVNRVLGMPIHNGLFLLAFFLLYLRRAILLGNRHQALGIFAVHPVQSWGKAPPANVAMHGEPVLHGESST